MEGAVELVGAPEGPVSYATFVSRSPTPEAIRGNPGEVRKFRGARTREFHRYQATALSTAEAEALEKRRQELVGRARAMAGFLGGRAGGSQPGQQARWRNRG